jgi:16S rRNA (adenine1518-N6/adenine1519-N6)-dimethyltransferase
MNPRQLLDQYEIQPKKSLGQNFMHDPNTLEKIVATADLQATDTVVEIGAGTGALTDKLAQVAGRVVAVELDERLIPILEQRFMRQRNVVIVHRDVLETDLQQLAGGAYIVVANVPYYITSAILRHVLEPAHRPRRVVMVMQLEVAERLIAQPKSGDMSLLTVSVQYYGKPRIVNKINRAVFYPRPDVDSALVLIETHAEPLVEVPSDEAFFRVVRAGFSQKRKQLRNSLGSGLHISSENADGYLRAAGIDPQRRAETLSLDEWASLTRAVNSAN